ncbi:hypothetical protein O6P43_006728 [Quillaja saponaria]|uniref:Uncharacterized protein n=1 Tax=Quillaja saponaria TaxID=32244 RepID=A0AAD7VIR9_QUISA|nr:hypothetical protein O6P43_006728 [Quillaja saponaria]
MPPLCISSADGFFIEENFLLKILCILRRLITEPWNTTQTSSHHMTCQEINKIDAYKQTIVDPKELLEIFKTRILVT